MLRTWLSPGTHLVGEEMFELEVRNLRAALVRAQADPGPAVLLKDRLSFGGPVKPQPMPVVPEEIVWPA
jgi:hypothetical protein